MLLFLEATNLTRLNPAEDNFLIYQTGRNMVEKSKTLPLSISDLRKYTITIHQKLICNIIFWGTYTPTHPHTQTHRHFDIFNKRLIFWWPKAPLTIQATKTQIQNKSLHPLHSIHLMQSQTIIHSLIYQESIDFTLSILIEQAQ